MTLYTETGSPLGTLQLTAEDGALTRALPRPEARLPAAATLAARRRRASAGRRANPAREYFDGRRSDFDLPAGAARHAVPAGRVAGAARRALRRHLDLRRDRRRDPPADGGARSRRGDRCQPDRPSSCPATASSAPTVRSRLTPAGWIARRNCWRSRRGRRSSSSAPEPAACSGATSSTWCCWPRCGAPSFLFIRIGGRGFGPVAAGQVRLVSGALVLAALLAAASACLRCAGMRGRIAADQRDHFAVAVRADELRDAHADRRLRVDAQRDGADVGRR